MSRSQDPPSENPQAADPSLLWQRESRRFLRGLQHTHGTSAEQLRVEEELAALLRDEAEAAGLDVADREVVCTFLSEQSERLDDLVDELSGQLASPTDAAGAPLIQRAIGDRGRPVPLLIRWSSELAADLRVAFRSLRKRPAMTALILLTLTLGIGLNTTVFSVLDSVFFRPHAVADPATLYKVFSSEPNGFLPEEPMAIPDLLDLGQSNGILGVAAQAMAFTALAQEERPAEIVVTEMVTDNTFEVLGVRPQLGRLFRSAPGSTGRAALAGNEGDVVLISATAWQKRWGGDPNVIGQVVRLNGHPLEVIGVVPQSYQGTARGLSPEMWMPLELGLRIGVTPSTNSGNRTADSLLDDRNRRSMWTILRAEAGRSPQQVQALADNVAAALATQYVDSNEDRTFRLLPYGDVKVMPMIDTSVDTASAVLLGVALLVLLIASTNLANLLLARALARRGEMATRLSLGASRLRIVRQLLVESLLLALVGALGGLGVAALATRAISAFRLDLMVPLQIHVQLDLRVVVYTIAVATLTSVVFGLAPAFEASRASLLEAMQAGSQRGGRKMRTQNALVTAQVAFSVVLLIFAGLMLRSLSNAADIDPGFDPDGVAGLVVAPATQGYSDDEVRAFYDKLSAELSRDTAIERFSLASHVPLSLTINSDTYASDALRGEDPETWPEVDTASVDEAYFDVLRIPLKDGRTFEARDWPSDDTDEAAADRIVPVVVNETLAAQFWPEDSAVGQLLTTDTGGQLSVVGVVGNGRYRTLGEGPRSFIYYPRRRDSSMSAVVARFRNPAAATPESVVKAVREVDPYLAITGQGTLREMTSTGLLIPRAAVTLFSVLGLIGLLLSAIGLFGVLTYAVSQRTREIGLRVAIGAPTAKVIRLVAAGGLRVTAIGVVIGCAVALATTRLLSAVLYGVSATDIWSFGGVAVLLLLVATVASVLPARAALRISPTEALRCD